MNNRNFLVPILYLLICLFWGSSWLVIKLSLKFITPFINLGLRFLVSAISISLVMIYTKTELDLSSKSISLYLLLGLFSYSIPFSLVYWADENNTIFACIDFVRNCIHFLLSILSSHYFCKEETLSLNRIIGILLFFSSG